jgi:hypothetical protein
LHESGAVRRIITGHRKIYTLEDEMAVALQLHRVQTIDLPVCKPPRWQASLPFTVKVVSNEEQLVKVQALRALAYSHHLPGIGETFGRPEGMDRHPDATLLFAQDKATGACVGSVRIQINWSAPLQIERAVELPAPWAGQLLAEITRLAVLPGYNDPPVRLALVKSSHLFCVAMQVQGTLAGARKSLIRQYRSLGFRDLFEDERMVPLPHAGGLEHRILCVDKTGFEERRRLTDDPERFVYNAHHPDIQIFDRVNRLSRYQPVESAA